MLIKELPPCWPPVVNASEIQRATSDLQDVVVGVENKGSGTVVVKLRKDQKYAPDYSITLTLPEKTLQRTIFSMMRHGATLRDVGEIDVAEQHFSAPQGTAVQPARLGTELFSGLGYHRNFAEQIRTRLKPRLFRR